MALSDTQFGKLPPGVSEWFFPKDVYGKYGLPGSKAAFSRMVKKCGWLRPEWQDKCWRLRSGHGGGYQYHYSLLSIVGKAKWLADKVNAETIKQPKNPDRSQLERSAAWSFYESISDKRKAVAKKRLAAVQAVEAMVRANGGGDVDLAYRMIATQVGASKASIYNWRQRLNGIPTDDWLAYLVDHRTGRIKTAVCDSRAWDYFVSDYLRLEQPSLTSCYRRLQRVAKDQGWIVPGAKTLERKLKREISPQVIVLTRKGTEALRRLYPAQRRSKAALHAMEAVDIDGHKWDVFVRWSDGDIVQPVMVAIHDIYSGKFLGWRIDKSENKEAVRLVIGDVVEHFGIFEHMYMDNGRAFASKWITGGVSNRYRYTIKEDDPTGILPDLGVEVHWTTPYSGQSKPIERAFRDMCDDIAKHPSLAGAYVGNSPQAKPENYGSRAVDLDLFLAVVEDGIKEHNARSGRRAPVCKGRSFDETFRESYQKSQIRRATEEQQRLWLMAAEGVQVQKRDGAINLMGNRYWAESLWSHRGDKITIRFDPQRLHSSVFAYRLDGSFIDQIPCVADVGYADKGEAQEQARVRGQLRKATKAAAEAHKKLKPQQLADMLPAAETTEPLQPGVTRIVTGHKVAAAVTKIPPPKELNKHEQARHEAVVEQMSKPAVVERDPKVVRFERALEIELALANSEFVSERDQGWFEGYLTNPEYRAQRKIFDRFGPEGLAGLRVVGG